MVLFWRQKVVSITIEVKASVGNWEYGFGWWDTMSYKYKKLHEFYFYKILLLTFKKHLNLKNLSSTQPIITEGTSNSKSILH